MLLGPVRRRDNPWFHKHLRLRPFLSQVDGHIGVSKSCIQGYLLRCASCSCHVLLDNLAFHESMSLISIASFQMRGANDSILTVNDIPAQIPTEDVFP